MKSAYLVFAILFLFGRPTLAVAQTTDAFITGIQVTDLQNSSNGSVLVDGVAGSTEAQWVPNNPWSPDSYPQSVLLDLAENYAVSEINLFHGNLGTGTSELEVKYLPLGKDPAHPADFILIENHSDANWNSYTKVAQTAIIQTRYIRLSVNSLKQAYNLSEIQIKGSKIAVTPPAPAPSPAPSPVPQPPTGGEVLITPALATDILNSANAKVLVDGFKGYDRPQWSSMNIWDPSAYPMVAQIDLGSVYSLSDIQLFHGNISNPSPQVQISFLPSGASPQSIDSYELIENHTDTMWNGYSQVKIARPVITRYLQLKISSLATFYELSEIQVRGVLGANPAPTCTPVGVCAVPDAGCTQKVAPTFDANGCQLTCAVYSCGSASLKTPMDRFIGINVSIGDPVDKMKVAGIVREYHNWNSDEGDIWSGGGNKNYVGYPNNQMKFAPSEAAGGAYNFDDFYGKVKDAGVILSPVIQGSVAWLQGRLDFPPENKPLDKAGLSSTDPNSYQAKSHHMFQFAARYGSTPVADRLLTLDASQPRKSGLSLVTYIEDWNEQDKSWQGPDANFSPEEYAAMASADYDGHANTMHQGSGTFGVKNADPKMKLVMGGVYQLRLDFVERMKAWFDANRADKKFALDVINFHDYAWATPAGPNGTGPALSPEDWDWKSKLTPFAQYRDKYLPGVELWISEFGYDTNPASPLAPPVISGFDSQEVQAQWIVRGFLAMAAAGVNRVQMFTLTDGGDASNKYPFNTAGLIRSWGDWTPKKSWYYVYTMKNALTDLVYLGEQLSLDPKVLIYKFKDPNSSKGAYVVWAKTKQNYTAPAYSLLLQGAPASASLIQLSPGSITGVSSKLPISGGGVTVPVSERPIFIQVDQIQ